MFSSKSCGYSSYQTCVSWGTSQSAVKLNNFRIYSCNFDKIFKNPQKLFFFGRRKKITSNFFYLGSIKVEFRTRKIKFFPLPSSSQCILVKLCGFRQRFHGIKCQSRILFYEQRAHSNEKKKCEQNYVHTQSWDTKCLA